MHHKGAVNGIAALDYLATTYPDAAEVVVVGASAGGVSSPLYGAMASDRLPDANVTVFADSSGAYADVPELNAVLGGGAWGEGLGLPDWFENPGEATGPALFTQSAHHDPDIAFARFDHASDENQASHLELAGVPVDDLRTLRTLIDTKDAQIEAAGVDLLTYTAPGGDHVVFGEDDFYSETVGGVALADWVTRVAAHEPVQDVG